MPSPVGHSLGGVIVALAVGRAASTHLLGLAALAACAPDLDFLWGRHNMETHSLGAALIAGALAGAMVAARPSLRRALGLSATAVAVVVGTAWLTHVTFDWLGSDDTPPLGVMALWPWTNNFYFAEAYVFEAISRRYWLPGFWRHNGWALVTEVVKLAPVVVALAIGRRWSARRRR